MRLVKRILLFWDLNILVIIVLRIGIINVFGLGGYFIFYLCVEG